MTKKDALRSLEHIRRMLSRFQMETETMEESEATQAVLDALSKLKVEITFRYDYQSGLGE